MKNWFGIALGRFFQVKKESVLFFDSMAKNSIKESILDSKLSESTQLEVVPPLILGGARARLRESAPN